MTTTTDTGPRIYVACLASYNAGRLYGRWIDATQEPEEIWAEVEAMLAKSPEPGAEEWAIHDVDNFEGWTPSEWESFETVSLMACMLEDHGDAWTAYVDHVGTEYATLEDFENSYRGCWDSERDYAEGFAGDMGLLNDLEDNPLRYHIDWDGYAREMFMGDLWSTRAREGGVHVFWRT